MWIEKSHVLIVDDDDRLRSLLVRFLSEQGFMVTAAGDAAEARRKMEWFAFDALVLDLMMPGETGLSLLAWMAHSRPVPVLMLSAMAEAKDRIKGLETGAEDYLAKPFEPQELVLRLRTMLQRRKAFAAPVVTFGDYVFDVRANRLSHGHDGVALTTGEAAVLRTLALSLGKPVSRDALAAAMPGAGSERSVDVQVMRLRKKIESGPGGPVHLQTVRGAGYVLYGKAQA